MEATRPNSNPTDPSAGPIDLSPLPLDLVSPQLTGRALLTGMLLGALLSICNIYVGLKFGWSANMSITSALLGFAFWSVATRLARSREFSILECNTVQTAASAAAAISSAGLSAPIPALAILLRENLTWPQLAIWLFTVCLTGVLVAVAMRRPMIVVSKLPFAVGISTAGMLREMYARGCDAFARVRVLLGAGFIGAAVTFFQSQYAGAWRMRPWRFGDLWISGLPAGVLTFALNPSPLFFAIGGLIGLRAAFSLLLGGILAWGVLVPRNLDVGIKPSYHESLTEWPEGAIIPDSLVKAVQYDERKRRLSLAGSLTETERDQLLGLSADPGFRRAITTLHERSEQHAFTGTLFQAGLEWLVWPGVTLMVISSLVQFGFSVRVIAKSFRAAAGGAAETDSGAAHGIPRGWFWAAVACVLCLTMWLQVTLFGINMWAAALSFGLAFVLAIVAARVLGETGINPVGSMGKVSQLVFGALLPASVTSNLMAANVTGGAAAQCADLMSDLKCGQLLGASPRYQVFAQLAGVVVGALFGTAVFLFLFPAPWEQLLTEVWPAPAVLTWKTFAELFARGFGDALPAGAQTAMIIAAITAIVLPTAEQVSPDSLRRWIPSATSLGMGMVVSAEYSIMIFVGAAFAAMLGRWCRSWSRRFLIVACSGLIAGESLTSTGMVGFETIRGLVQR